ncbi:MAG: hypothetical protein MI749_21545, partial [Desulfovibrionales bacterium]|nr:hypothetical protein [Desulfovibrionales bacterium]
MIRIFRRPTTLTWFLTALCLLGVYLALWAFVIEPNRIDIHTQTLSLPNWDSGPRDLKVAVLADLHIGAPFV